MNILLRALFLSLFMSISGMGWAQNYVANQVITLAQSPANVKTALQQTSQVHPEWQLDLQRTLSAHANVYLLEFDSTKVSAPQVVAYLKQQEALQLVQVNHTNVTQRSTVPNDLSYPVQWSMQSAGALTVINAPDAWTLEKDGVTALGDTVVMAVVDGGVDIQHVDLNLFKNTHDIPNNGIDDDQNGYIDDYHGWNAVFQNGQPIADPHGTHIAGIMGARTNNVTGVAGIVWDGKILPIVGSSNIESVVLEAYGYALALREQYNATNGDSGAYVVCTNSSFGVDQAEPADYPIWCAFYDSLGQAGIVNLGATTNGTYDVDVFGDIPTTCPSSHLIAVTNLTQSGVIYGGWGEENIDLGAPGFNIYSTLPGHNYGYKTGTSMATPHVAGVVGAIFSAMCEDQMLAYTQKPDSMALEVRRMILDNVTPLSSLNGKIATRGTLNMYAALVDASNNNCMVPNATTYADSCNSCDGMLTTDVDGKYPPFTVEIMTLDSTIVGNDTAAQLCADSFIIQVTDSVGLRTWFTQEIDHPDTLRNTISTVQPTNNSTFDGEIVLTTQGGNGAYSYVWNTGETTAGIYNIATGIYMATTTDEKNCTQIDTVNLYSVGITDIPSTAFRLFPNPAETQITIESQENIERIQLLDITGKVVHSQIGNHALHATMAIDVPSGIYFVRINQRSVNVLFVK